jgi:hypothetical protein
MSEAPATGRALLLLAACVLAGCAPRASQPGEDLLTTSTAGLQRQEVRDAVVYLPPPGTPRKVYGTVLVQPVRFGRPSPEMSAISAADLDMLARSFRDTVSAKLAEAGIRTVDRPEPGDYLELRLVLSGLHPGNPAANVIQFLPVGVALDVGGVTIESAFVDGASGQVTAVALVEMTGARKFNPNAVNGRWGDVLRAFEDWAAGFAERMRAQASAGK